MDTARTMEQAPLAERVKGHKEWLVKTGEDIGKAGAKNRDWKSQGRTMLEAARHETEPLVLLNLLRYQATRNNNWTKPANLLEKLETAMLACREKAKEDAALAMELIRHVLLYALRAYTFHEERKEKGGGGD